MAIIEGLVDLGLHLLDQLALIRREAGVIAVVRADHLDLVEAQIVDDGVGQSGQGGHGGCGGQQAGENAVHGGSPQKSYLPNTPTVRKASGVVKCSRPAVPYCWKPVSKKVLARLRP